MTTEFTPGTRPEGPDCADAAVWGSASALDQYIAKIKIEPESTYPSDACPPYYYSTAKIDNFTVTTSLTLAGPLTGTTATFSGLVSAGSFSSNSKAFNIPHPSPNKEGIRLWHGCLEGPEYGVYVRGRVTNQKEINLPKYWKDLVDVRSITVSLTPIGAHQNVIVKRLDEQKIYLQAQGGMPIDCFYHVYGERKDIDPLVIEQEAVDTDP
jgi:hypothetical protein